MEITFEYRINNLPCEVFAAEFTEDESVGIWLGPEEIWAQSMVSGIPIEIPDDILDRLLILATNIYRDRISEPDDWEYDF